MMPTFFMLKPPFRDEIVSRLRLNDAP
jgi:hypothetical protein